MSRRRKCLWGAIALVALAIAVLTCSPAVTRVAEGLWGNRPEFPVAAHEREFLKGWRRADFEPAVPMFSMPFNVPVAEADPEVEAIVLHNTTTRAIRNFWLYREDMPNFYSARTIVESVTQGKETETDKALALWGLFPQYYYNFYPISSSGLQHDPSTLLAVTGTGQCDQAAKALETLCQLAGCETRTIGIEYDGTNPRIAHCAMEVKADGRWIFLDPDGHAVYRRADGQWAGARDLMADSTPIQEAGHGYFNPCAYANAFSQGTVIFYDHTDGDIPSFASRHEDPASFLAYHHYMRFDLLPGATLTLFPKRKGRCFELDLPVAASGTLHWSLLSERLALPPDGLLLHNASLTVDHGKALLKRIHIDKPGSLVVPLTSCFLTTGGQLDLNAEAVGGVDVYALPFLRCAMPAGEGWVKLGTVSGQGGVSLDKVCAMSPMFGYALRIDVPVTGATIRSMESLTHLQCAPKALPYLAQGDNRFILYADQPYVRRPVLECAEGKSDLRFQNGVKLTFVMSRPAAVLNAKR